MANRSASPAHKLRWFTKVHADNILWRDGRSCYGVFFEYEADVSGCLGFIDDV